MAVRGRNIRDVIYGTKAILTCGFIAEPKMIFNRKYLLNYHIAEYRSDGDFPQSMKTEYIYIYIYILI